MRYDRIVSMKKSSIILFLIFSIVCVLVIYKVFIEKKSESSFQNILLISVDTLRADHMGIYGYNKNTTPNIDQWAKNATLFSNVQVEIPATHPSFVTFMTGKSAFETGIRNNWFIINDIKGTYPVPLKLKTFAEILQNNGYETAAFLTNGILSPKETNLNKGFNTYKVIDYWGGKDRNKYESLIDDGIQWMGDHKEKKQFMWIHLMDPHSPYFPTDENACKFNEKYCLEIKQRGIKDIQQERNSLEGCHINGLSENKVELMETLYDGTVADMDTLVGKILHALEANELEDNTLVIFYGDHGEGFDHNYYFHHSEVLYNSSTHVPLIIKVPGNFQVSKNSDLIDNTQILPTLLKLVDIPFNSAEFSKDFADFFISPSGNSLKRKDKYIYGVNVNLTQFSLQNARYKYVFRKEKACGYDNLKEELFDISKDFDESDNIIKQNEALAQDMKKKLIDYIRKSSISSSKNIKYENMSPAMKVTDEELRDKLRTLGY